jgi:hypothetical protein
MPRTVFGQLPNVLGQSGTSLEQQLAALREEMPKGILGYAKVTSSQGSITSQTDLTGATVTVHVPPRRLIKVEYHSPLRSTVAGDRILLRAYEDSTELGIAGIHVHNASQTLMISGVAVSEPAAGSHTYKLTMQRASGSGTVSTEASSTNPMYIIISDAGPA